MQGIGAEDPYLYARVTLAECRKSCRVKSVVISNLDNFCYFQESFQNLTNLPAMIEKYGGLEDFVVDPFGFKYPLCAGNGGFTSAGRCQPGHALNDLISLLPGLMFCSSTH